MATAFLGVLLKVGGARLCHAGMVLLQMRQTRRAERGRADLARQERRREQQLALSGRME